MTLDNIIKKIAKQHHTTSENVLNEIVQAFESAKSTNDPIVQARWNAIPHDGDEVTLEELIEYFAMISRLSS